MKKIIILLIILSTNLVIANTKEGLFGGFGGPEFGVLYQDISDFNKKLNDNNYSQINQYPYNFGGRGLGIVNNICLGGFGAGTIEEVVDNSINVISISRGYGFFNIGYVILDLFNFKIIPSIGYGSYGIYINISRSTTTNVNFLNIINNPGHSTKLNYSSPAYNINLLTLFFDNFVGIGINIGYIFMPKSTWYININKDINNKAINAPLIGEHIAYVSIGIYFGNLAKNYEKFENGTSKYNPNSNKEQNSNVKNELKENIDKTIEDLKNN